jgi:transposase
MEDEERPLPTPLHLLALFSILENLCTFWPVHNDTDFYRKVQLAITIEMKKQKLLATNTPQYSEHWKQLDKYFEGIVANEETLKTYTHVNFGDILIEAAKIILPEDEFWYEKDQDFKDLIQLGKELLVSGEEVDCDEITESSPTVSHSEYYTSKDI